MKRSAAIITATFAVLAMSSCSTIRQYDLMPDGEPTPTTVYVIDIGTPAFPVLDVPTCDAAGNPVPCQPGTPTTPVPSNDPPCDAAGNPRPCQGSTPVTSPPANGLCPDGVHPIESGCPTKG